MSLSQWQLDSVTGSRTQVLACVTFCYPYTKWCGKSYFIWHFKHASPLSLRKLFTIKVMNYSKNKTPQCLSLTSQDPLKLQFWIWSVNVSAAWAPALHAAEQQDSFFALFFGCDLLPFTALVEKQLLLEIESQLIYAHATLKIIIVEYSVAHFITGSIVLNC